MCCDNYVWAHERLYVGALLVGKMTVTCGRCMFSSATGNKHPCCSLPSVWAACWLLL